MKYQGMLRRIRCGVLILPLLLMPLLFGARAETVLPGADGTNGLIPAASAGEYALYVDEEQGRFTVVHQKTGKSWQSAQEAVSGDGEEASLLKIWYYTAQSEEKMMTSYADSVSKNQFSFEETGDGVRMNFVLGQDTKESILPRAMTWERMQQLILEPLEGTRAARRVQVVYRLLSEEEALSPEDFENWKKEYPILAQTPIYILNDVTDRELEEISGIFRELGYTAEMAEEDNRLAGVSDEGRSTPYFRVPLHIRLTQDGITASVVVEDIEYNPDFPPRKLALLEYFGAAPGGEQGGIFYPDGSGTLISFGDAANPNVVKGITKPVYGTDDALTPAFKAGTEQPIRLPVFGMLRADSAFLGVIEQGDATAELTVQLSESAQPANRVYPSFTLRQKNEFDFGDVAGAGFKWTVYDKKGYDGEIRVRYFLLPDEQATVGRLAGVYREYLLKNEFIKKQTLSEHTPFYLHTMGTFTHPDTVLGISVNVKDTLTTFSQAEEMAAGLLDAGVKNLKLRYTGWANGGLENTAYRSVRPERKLGGKKGLTALSAALKVLGVGFYPDLEFLYVRKDTIFDAFSSGKHAIRMLDKKIGGSVALYYGNHVPDPDRFAYAVSPDVSLKFAENAAKQREKLNLDAVSVGSLGESLYSNFASSRYHNRQMSQDTFTKLAALFAENPLMTSGGNAYVLPYAGDVVNIPSDSSRYQLRQQRVPFLQMVLHGLVDYAGAALNLSGDYETAVLTAAMNGGGVQYLLNYDHVKYLRETAWSDYFATAYQDWKDEAARAYRRLSAVLDRVRSAEMQDFRVLSEQVYETVYSDGHSVIVNFSNAPYHDSRGTVPARDFVLAGA